MCEWCGMPLGDNYLRIRRTWEYSYLYCDWDCYRAWRNFVYNIKEEKKDDS